MISVRNIVIFFFSFIEQTIEKCGKILGIAGISLSLIIEDNGKPHSQCVLKAELKISELSQKELIHCEQQISK